MPRKLQQRIKTALLRAPRIHNGIFEKRVMINGIKIEAASQDPEICEEKFLKVLAEKFGLIRSAAPNAKEHTAPPEPTAPDHSDVSFAEWADLWFTEVYQYSVIPYTYERGRKAFFRHVIPFFGDRKLKTISPLDCIRFFNTLKQQGIERTAESIYGNLNRVFAFAVDSEIITKNPLSGIKPIKHTRVNGLPLTTDEEHALLQAIRGTRYEAAILLRLYAGLRPCEVPSAHIEGRFIISENRKQKDQSIKHYKKIPITPMLEPYRDLITESIPLQSPTQYACSCAIKEALPNHRPYDLRLTFATRAQECGVLEQVVQLFMGHAPSTLLGRVYTKFSDDFLFNEGQKIHY